MYVTQENKHNCVTEQESRKSCLNQKQRGDSEVHGQKHEQMMPAESDCYSLETK